ncbi:MAG: RNA-binding protein, partial [Rhizonema sp. PD38]|nr:RNA-binding protein [Rhizonema sp. PD38]
MMTDTPMQRGQEWLESLLRLSGVSVHVKGELETAAVQYEESQEPDNYWLTIDQTNLKPEQIQIFIGSDGSVLDAIQYLANSILNLNQITDGQASYTIELNGYRVQRQEEIRAMAEAAAEQVRSSSQEVEIKSLSSAERRQIHTYLK